MDVEDRVDAVIEQSDRAIRLVRTVRRLAQQRRHVDPSEFSDLADAVASMRHHCEMLNQERIDQMGGNP